MALTKVTGQVINDSTGLVVGVTTVGGGLSATDGFFSGIVTAVGDASFSGNVSVGGTLTYEDVTNIDAVGLVTARNGIVVGSGITLSKDGDIFATGITTISENLKVGTGVTISPDGDGFYTGVVTATSYRGDGSNLTGVSADVVDDTSPQLGGDLDLNGKIIRVDDGGPNANQEHIRFGNDGDLRIYHDGTDSIIKDTRDSGTLRIHADSIAFNDKDVSETMLLATVDGSVDLRFNGNKKIETTNTGVVVTGILTATKGGVGIGSTTYSARVAGVSTVVGTIQYDAEVNKVVVFTKALQWQGIHEVGQLPQLGLMGAYNFFMPNTYSDFSNTEQVRCASAFFSRYDQAGGVNQSGDAAQYCTNSGGLDNGPYINYVGRTDPSNHFFYLGYSHTNLKYDHTSYSCWYRGDNSVGNGSWYTGTTLLGDTRNSVAGNFGFNSAGKIAMHINNNSAIEYTGSKTVNDNTWHCLGFTSTPSTLKLFVDGELMTSEGNPGYHNNLYLDAVGGNYNYADMVPERMAAVAMWNRELTEAEMKQAFLARNFNSMGNDFVDIKNN